MGGIICHPSFTNFCCMHGAEIINHFDLMPIGKLCKEVSEPRNKDFRKIKKKQHARKFSSIASNEHIFNELLISSDPFISLKPVFSGKAKTKRILNSLTLMRA